MTIGLDHKSVKLVPFSTEWKDLFEEEEKIIRSTLGERVLLIEHIGSTAIPGIVAKPIIDIAATVPDESDIEKCVQPLVDAGYEYKGEYGLPGRHFFIKGVPSTHHLHVVVSGSHHWKSWLLFRDYLIEHPELANDYSAEKQELAATHASDREGYTMAKGSFIVQVLEQAEAKR